MHLWSVQARYGHPSIRSIPRTPFLEKSGLWNSAGYYYGCKVEDSSGNFDINPGKSKSARYSFVVKAMGKKNPGNSSGDAGRSIPEGDGHKEHNPNESKKSSDSVNQRPHHVTLDWREFRAQLFAREQAETTDSTVTSIQGDSSDHTSKPLGLKWAHPISLPETGSVLVATEKLDGIENFERTVILLLRSGTRNPQEGPFGIIVNRPLNKKIKQMRPTNPDLSKTLAECSLHIGGPLDASMFLVRTEDAKSSKISGFEEVLPGLCFGSRNSLDDAISHVKEGVLKPQDFRFFRGYAGWQYDQLLEEIEAKYWHVAACSANLIFSVGHEPSESLWEEILQLMGGQYSELSRKPKQNL